MQGLSTSKGLGFCSVKRDSGCRLQSYHLANKRATRPAACWHLHALGDLLMDWAVCCLKACVLNCSTCAHPLITNRLYPTKMGRSVARRDNKLLCTCCRTAVDWKVCVNCVTVICPDGLFHSKHCLRDGAYKYSDGSLGSVAVSIYKSPTNDRLCGCRMA